MTGSKFPARFKATIHLKVNIDAKTFFYLYFRQNTSQRKRDNSSHLCLAVVIVEPNFAGSCDFQCETQAALK